jgi:alpha-tubulin suppressor-like RCC1 family protein
MSPGELGNGTATNSFTDSPVTVSGLHGATGVAAAAGHSCAVLNDGTIQCWGTDDNGQLGDGNSGTYAESATPVQVLNIANATSVAAGDNHTCARLADGTVTCWGANSSGELGDGTTTDSATLVAVSRLTDATSVATGLDYSCATRANGQVACWGTNDSGQLGNGKKTASHTPVSVIGVQDALAVAAGSSHACAVLSSGGVVCWGDGSLGNGTTATSTTPVAVKQLG